MSSIKTKNQENANSKKNEEFMVRSVAITRLTATGVSIMPRERVCLPNGIWAEIPVVVSCSFMTDSPTYPEVGPITNCEKFMLMIPLTQARTVKYMVGDQWTKDVLLVDGGNIIVRRADSDCKTHWTPFRGLVCIELPKEWSELKAQWRLPSDQDPVHSSDPRMDMSTYLFREQGMMTIMTLPAGGE